MRPAVAYLALLSLASFYLSEHKIVNVLVDTRAARSSWAAQPPTHRNRRPGPVLRKPGGFPLDLALRLEPSGSGRVRRRAYGRYGTKTARPTILPAFKAARTACASASGNICVRIVTFP